MRKLIIASVMLLALVTSVSAAEGTLQPKTKFTVLTTSTELLVHLIMMARQDDAVAYSKMLDAGVHSGDIYLPEKGETIYFVSKTKTDGLVIVKSSWQPGIVLHASKLFQIVRC